MHFFPVPSLAPSACNTHALALLTKNEELHISAAHKPDQRREMQAEDVVRVSADNGQRPDPHWSCANSSLAARNDFKKTFSALHQWRNLFFSHRNKKKGVRRKPCALFFPAFLAQGSDISKEVFLADWGELRNFHMHGRHWR